MEGDCWCKIIPDEPLGNSRMRYITLCGMTLEQIAAMRDEYEAHGTLKLTEDVQRWKKSCELLQSKLDSRDEFLAKMPQREMKKNDILRTALELIVSAKKVRIIRRARQIAREALLSDAQVWMDDP